MALLQAINSRDNASVKGWRKLAQDNHAYRRQSQLWLEGEHLCEVAVQRHLPVDVLVVSQSLVDSGGAQQWLHAANAKQNVVLPDALLATISPMESPAQLAMVLPWAASAAINPLAPTVVLDRLQDAGNVGAILRAAAAFGFGQIIANRGTAGLWSPKVLRAGMGAHFGLQLIEQAEVADIEGLAVPLLLTSSHQGDFLHEQQLPWPCAWVMGHEGQGVSAALEEIQHIPVRIAQPGGQESLNVANAAAICLHASAVASLRRA